MIVVAAFEAPAVVAGLDDVAVVSKAVEQRGCHLGVAEHAEPLVGRQCLLGIRQSWFSGRLSLRAAERLSCLDKLGGSG